MDFLLKKRVIDTLKEHLSDLERDRENGIESTSPAGHTAYDNIVASQIADVKQLIGDVEAEPITG